MRDAQKWRRPLIEDIKGLEQIHGPLPAGLSATRFLDTELILTLLADHLPGENPEYAWAVLDGHNFPNYQMLSSGTKRAIKNARFRLLNLLGRGRWERDFALYQKMAKSSPYPLYEIKETGNGKIISSIETAILPNRLTLMREALENPPGWASNDPRYAQAGHYRFYQNKQSHEVEIGEGIAAVGRIEHNNLTRLSMKNTSSSQLIVSERSALKISLEELIAEARWMDKHAPAGSPAAQEWEERIRKIKFNNLVQGQGLSPSDRLEIDGLLHLIGMVGSGKSSLFTVLTVYLARRGMHVTLVQSDVASLLREMQVFETFRTTEPKIMAVPLVGRSTRLTHLNRLHAVEAQRHGVTLGGMHPAYQMLSTVCPLDGLRRDVSEPIRPGSEPCNRLYQINQDEDQNNDAGELIVETTRNRRDCPLMSVCPVHLPTRLLADATIYLATPASLLVSGPQPPLVAEEVRNIELIMRHSDLVLVDEADLVQVQFDNRFAPMEVLIGKGDSWLDKLINQVTRQVYRAGRPLIGKRIELDYWLTAHLNTQRAADCLYRWLRDSRANREWLGKSYFSGGRLMNRMEDEFKKYKLPLENFQAARIAFDRRSLGSLQTTSYNNGLRGVVATPTEWVIAAQLELFEANTIGARNQLLNWLEANFPVETLKTLEVEALADRLLMTLIVNVLDYALQDVIDRWPSAIESLELDYGTGGLFYQPQDSLVRLVPEPGMGAILGFQYYDPENGGEGDLRFFQLRGVGRDLLYHLHDSYKLSHGWPGPHVVLTSGTSWAPGSWRYNLHKAPEAVLLPERKDETAQTRCFFTKLPDPDNPGQFLYVSGKSNPVERIRSLKAMIRELARPRSNGFSRFDNELKELDAHRQRILLVVGSYAEAEAVGEALVGELKQVEEQTSSIAHEEGNTGKAEDQVLVLIPDSEAELDLPSPSGKLYRSMLQNLSQKPARFLITPLQAIERGHNILVGQEAAIGSVYFLTRPMPVPGDLQSAVQRINSWTLEQAKKLDAPTLGEAGYLLREKSRILWDEVLEKKETYGGLSQVDREKLLWTQLVLIWQCIGRLLRGGVSARVHFVDAKWAPVSASLIEGETDSVQTSMLIGFREILQAALEDHDPVQRDIASAIYGSFASALENIRGVKYAKQ